MQFPPDQQGRGQALILPDSGTFTIPAQPRNPDHIVRRSRAIVHIGYWRNDEIPFTRRL
jgi:hypothetical protein